MLIYINLHDIILIYIDDLLILLPLYEDFLFISRFSQW